MCILFTKKGSFMILLLILLCASVVVFWGLQNELSPEVIYKALKMSRLPVYIQKITGPNASDRQWFASKDSREFEDLLEAIKRGVVIGVARREPEGRPSEIFDVTVPGFGVQIKYYKEQNLLAIPSFFKKKRGLSKISLLSTGDFEELKYMFTHIILLKPAPEFAEILSRIEREENEFKLGSVVLHLEKSVVVPVFPVGR